MLNSKHPTDERNAQFTVIFTNSKCVDITHFYSIGRGDSESPVQASNFDPRSGPESFAYGFWDYSGFFRQGITKWDGENFDTKL